MSEPQLRVSCVGLPAHLAEALTPLVEGAGRALEMGHEVAGIRICGDDLPGGEGVWYRWHPGPTPKDRPVLVLFCHPGCFGPLERASDSVYPPRAVWEQGPAPGEEPGFQVERFSPARAGIFLHHHLLTARDIARRVVVGRKLPAGLAEAFTEAWAVCVDGRLARGGLPGFPLSERRGRFARIFSPAGILLPDHWQVFQSLWDGALTGQKEVTEAIKLLPGL